MPEKIRILIVEDNPIWADFLDKRYKFEVADILRVDRNFVECECVASFDEASRKIQDAQRHPFDLVSLDINLGNSSDDDRQDGLQLLGEIAEMRAAWMVAILTGVENDTTFTGKRANIVQRNLRSFAMQAFPPERLVVIEKPTELTDRSEMDLSGALADSAVLGNRIKQVVSIFEHTSTNRNVFRKLILLNQYKDGAEANEDEEEDLNDELPEEESEGSERPKRQPTEWIQGAVVHWQIRFDCGEMITIPEKKGMEVIRVLLENPRQEFAYGALEAAAIGEAVLSKEDLISQMKPKSMMDGRTLSEQITAQMDGESSEDSGADDLESGASAAMEMVFAKSGSVKDENFDDTEKQTRDSYIRDLQKIETSIKELEIKKDASKGKTLKLLKEQAAALRKEIKKLRRGGRSPEATRVAAHKSRVIASLRKQGLVDFANHLDECIKAKGSVIYWPPFDMNWQTE